jgi:hypothetical protein
MILSITIFNRTTLSIMESCVFTMILAVILPNVVRLNVTVLDVAAPKEVRVLQFPFLSVSKVNTHWDGAMTFARLAARRVTYERPF